MNKAIDVMAMVFLVCAAQATAAQPLSAAAVKSAKVLAGQSVLHVQTGLKKVSLAGPLADKGKIQREVITPAVSLLKEWRALGMTDAQAMLYTACQSILGDLQVYAADATLPPKYHLSAPAVQKLRFMNEDLTECKKAAAGKS